MSNSNELMPQIMESVLMVGDLSKLSPQQRVQYYAHVCDSMKLNPLTKPFDYINLNGRLTLYATKNCTDQLRNRDAVSLRMISREIIDGIYVVTVAATTPDGRTDESSGAVSVEGLKGEARANSYMKAETKAKRRATLSICGMGILDETEIESIPSARPVRVDSQGQISEGTGTVAPEMQPTPKQQEQEAPPVETKPKPTHEQLIMIEAFQRLKKQLGENLYYDRLRRFGYAHCNEITDVKKGRSIYKEMLNPVEAANEVTS